MNDGGGRLGAICLRPQPGQGPISTPEPTFLCGINPEALVQTRTGLIISMPEPTILFGMNPEALGKSPNECTKFTTYHYCWMPLLWLA